MRNISAILGVVLVCCLTSQAVTLTFNGATAYQRVDGIGVNLNYSGWQGTNLIPVLDRFIEDAGMSYFRVVYELSDWEAINDNADPSVMDWDYFNGVYGGGEPARLWDMMSYLNQRGFTDRAFFCFMGWGPQWMMDSSYTNKGVRPRLQAGMEAEWAEMVASAVIYARNQRGLQFSLFAPNNEPDLDFEGIGIASAQQYTNAMNVLVNLLDQNSVTNLGIVAPDRAAGGNAWMPEMMNSAAIMQRVRHFGTHAYQFGDGATPWLGTLSVHQFITNSPYADRSLWLTEFNKWCEGCDNGVPPEYTWSFTRGTAENLIWHLACGASAAFVWEGYDSIYKHHFDAWSYWGLLGVNNTNAVNKTYTPRKHFYTVSQVSKWVRPGAQRIGISGGTSPFAPMIAFKHDELGQVTVVGVNTATSGTTKLEGTLTNLPAVTELELYYTTESASSNLVFGGRFPVTASGKFTNNIPPNCVFTLTGYTAKRLTNGVARFESHPAGSAAPEHFRFTVTNPAPRVQFEIHNSTSDVSLLVGKGRPSDWAMPAHFVSDNPGTNDEMVVLRPGSGPMTLTPGEWFLTVANKSGSAVEYSIEATQWTVSGVPLVVNTITIDENAVCLSWNSLPGARYLVQGKEPASYGEWAEVSPTVTASNVTTTFCIPMPTPFSFFRVLEGVAVNNP